MSSGLRWAKTAIRVSSRAAAITTTSTSRRARVGELAGAHSCRQDLGRETSMMSIARGPGVRPHPERRNKIEHDWYYEDTDGRGGSPYCSARLAVGTNKAGLERPSAGLMSRLAYAGRLSRIRLESAHVTGGSALDRRPD